MTSFASIDALRKHADWLRATYDFGYMEAQAKLCEFAADELYRLSAPPSQGKVERAQEISHNIVSYCRECSFNLDVLKYTREEAEEYVIAAITQALTESSGQDARACTCHPDDNPPVPCPRKFSLSECRKSSGQGTDGACCEAMREAILSIIPGGDICDPQQIADAIRALPLPVSAEVMPAWPDLSFEERRDITTLLQQTAGARTRYENVRGYLRTNVKSKQPSDTGGEK